MWSSSDSSIRLATISSGLDSSKWKIIVETTNSYFYGTYRLVNKSNESKSISISSASSGTVNVVVRDTAATSGMQKWVFEEVLTATSSTPARNNAAPPAPHNGTYGSQGYTTGHYARDVAPMDITALNTGAYPLYADRDGTITYWVCKTSTNTTQLGNFATIKHSDGSGTLYAHMSMFTVGAVASGLPGTTTDRTYAPVKTGASRAVKRGEIIGYIGKSGSATGWHVHLEYVTNHDAIWANSSTATHWNNVTATYKNNIKDPKNYMKIWWQA